MRMYIKHTLLRDCVLGNLISRDSARAYCCALFRFFVHWNIEVMLLGLVTMQSNVPSNRSLLTEKNVKGKIQEPTVIKREDVLLGRGKCNFKHTGNVAYRVLIDTRLEKYIASDSRSEKTHMVVQVVETITEAGGRFLKQETNSDNWYPVDKKTAREKVGHSFRDAIKAKNSSAIRVEEKVDSSITVKSSFGEILRWLTDKHHVGAGKASTISTSAPAKKLARPSHFPVAHRASSDSTTARKKTSSKRKIPPSPSASRPSQVRRRSPPSTSLVDLELISQRAAHTYMNLSDDEKRMVARRASLSLERSYAANMAASLRQAPLASETQRVSRHPVGLSSSFSGEEHHRAARATGHSLSRSLDSSPIAGALFARGSVRPLEQIPSGKEENDVMRFAAFQHPSKNILKSHTTDRHAPNHMMRDHMTGDQMMGNWMIRNHTTAQRKLTGNAESSGRK